MNTHAEFLLARRSASLKGLAEPGPTRAELGMILTVASRTPDHGRLTPWRFVVVRGDGRGALGALVGSVFAADHPGADAEAVSTARRRFESPPLTVAVVCRARVGHPANPKIPESEQVLTCGAVCMNLLHACHASGFGAVWLSGWASYDRRVLDILGLDPAERLAGFVHVGTEPQKQAERARPEQAELVTYFESKPGPGTTHGTKPGTGTV